MIESYAKMKKYYFFLSGVLFLCLVSLLFIYFSMPADFSSLIHDAAHTPELPADGEGIYFSCAPSLGITCLSQLQAVSRQSHGIVNLIINYDQFAGSFNQVIAYAQFAHSQGIKIIWDFANPYLLDMHADPRQNSEFKYFVASCKSCITNKSFITFAVNQVKLLPATWRYYIGDEPSLSEHAEVKAVSDYIHTLDPHHSRLLVLQSPGKDVNPNLLAFSDTAEVISQDYYPINPSHYPISYTVRIAKGVQQIAAATHKSMAMVLQATSLIDYNKAYGCHGLLSRCPWPTVNQMATQLTDVTDNANPRIILWYSYFDMINSGKPDSHFRDLVDAIDAVK